MVVVLYSDFVNLLCPFDEVHATLGKQEKSKQLFHFTPSGSARSQF